MRVLEGAPGCGADIARRLLSALGVEVDDDGVTTLLTYRPPWDVPEVPIGAWVTGHRALLALLAADDTGSVVLVEAAALVAATASVADAVSHRLGLVLPSGPDAPATLRVAVVRAAGLGVGRRADLEPAAKLLAGLPVDARLVLGELDRQAAVRGDGQAPVDSSRLVPTDHPDPQVAVVIRCRDDGARLLDALASVRAAASTDRLETVVVDDGSADGATLAVLDAVAAGGVTVIRRPGAGTIGAARNAAAAAARAPFLLPLDVNDLLRPGFATAGAAALLADDAAAVAHPDAQRFGAADGRWETAATDPDQLLRGNHVPVCAVIRRTAFDAVGGFDESMPMGMEDWDLWLSLRAAGGDLRHLPLVGFDVRVPSGPTAEITLAPAERNAGFALVLAKHRDLLAARVDHVIPQFLDALDAERARADAAEAAGAALQADRSAELVALAARLSEVDADLAATRREAHVLRDQVAAQAEDLERRERGFANARARAAEEETARMEAQAQLARTVAALDEIHHTITFRAVGPLRALYGRLRGR